MKAKLLFLATALFSLVIASAQEIKKTAAAEGAMPQKNLLKLNLASLAVRNYSLQYERVLSRKVSLALSYRLMPNSGVPFKNAVLNAMDDDPDTREIINNTSLSNFALTPEVRFYLGKGYGKGFYIAPYYRYVSFATSDVPVSYDNSLLTRQTINLKGDLKAYTGGLLFGAQWMLGKHLALDWWILGAHYGSGTGNFDGVPKTPLTLPEQQQIRRKLEDIDLPMTKKTVTVTANRVAVTMDGPFAGLRAGVNLGFRF